MSRSVLTLAALATAAVPGLSARSVEHGPPSDGYDTAVVYDDDARPWAVRAPRTVAAGAAMEAETSLLAALDGYVADGSLPFAVPRISGTTLLPEGGHAVVYPRIEGSPVDIEALRPGPGIGADLGRAIAALHELAPAMVEVAGLPVYTAEEYRERRLAEIDEAASTGKVPFSLLNRWEQSLEDVSMWRFRPVPIHGDLGAEQVLVRAGRVVAMTDWSEARVADPADDLAWLVVAAPAACVETIFEAYTLRRSEATDPGLARRARVVGELALARWLVHGIRTRNSEIISDAEDMLLELAASTASDE